MPKKQQQKKSDEQKAIKLSPAEMDVVTGLIIERGQLLQSALIKLMKINGEQTHENKKQDPAGGASKPSGT